MSAVAPPNLNYEFSAEPAGAAAGPNVQLQYIDKNDPHQTRVGINTNLAYVTLELLYKRFFADIIKDSQAGTAVPADKILQLLQKCYPALVDLIPPSIAHYKTILHDIEDKVFGNIKDKIHEHLNIPKTTGCGNNLGVSDAHQSIWESGYGPAELCRNPVQTIITPASKLDPLGKGTADIYWPDDNVNLTFGKNFCNRLGFPNTEWKKEGTRITITYTDNSTISDRITENTTLANLKASLTFGPYLQGNSEKNTTINGLDQNNADNWSRFIKLVETKALGDVAQVWLYFAYVVLHYNGLTITTKSGTDLGIRSDVVMLTTDSVVYLLCVILNLACVYSGSKHGWMPHTNSCTLYSHIPGEIDYRKKFTTMLDIVFERIMNHNLNTAITLSAARKKLSTLFYYYTLRRGGKIALSNNYHKADVNTIIKTYIKTLEEQTNAAQVIYNVYYEKKDTILTQGDIDREYAIFLSGMNPFHIVHVVTRINAEKTILMPESPLTMAILTIINIPSVTKAHLQSGSSSTLSNMAGGAFVKQPNNSSIESYNDYNTCLMLCYTYYTLSKMVRESNNTSAHLNVIPLGNNNIMNNIFPLFYDYYISLITVISTEDYFSSLQDLVPRELTGDHNNLISHIKEFGTELAEYVPFQEHYTKAKYNVKHIYTVSDVNTGFSYRMVCRADNGAARLASDPEEERAAHPADTGVARRADNGAARLASDPEEERAARTSKKQEVSTASANPVAAVTTNLHAASLNSWQQATRQQTMKNWTITSNGTRLQKKTSPAPQRYKKAISALESRKRREIVVAKLRERKKAEQMRIRRNIKPSVPRGVAAATPPPNFVNPFSMQYGGTRRHHKKLNNIKSKKQRKLRNRNAAIRPPKTRSAPSRLRRVLRATHSTRKKAARTRY